MVNRINAQIPKVVHYCWFGGNPLGEAERKCIDSWKRYLPGYEIVQWDEHNFDIQRCRYVAQAYEARKWAFVSDYARFSILYEHGGLYFDTDVELIRSIDDIVAKGPFMGFERDPAPGEKTMGPAVAPGLGLAANPGLGLYRLILDSYEKSDFIKRDGSLDLTTVVSRTTEILRQRGLTDIPGIQHVDGVDIYPKDYFNPKDYLTGKIEITDNTRSIHHFGMSWLSEGKQYTRKLTFRLVEAGFPSFAARLVAKVISTVRYGEYRELAKSISRHIKV